MQLKNPYEVVEVEQCSPNHSRHADTKTPQETGATFEEFSFSMKYSVQQSFKPSGVHEKYLEDSSRVAPSFSLPRQAHSETYSHTEASRESRSVVSQPVSLAGRAKKPTKAAKKLSPADLKIDPRNAGLRTLQADQQRLLNMMETENDTGVLFSHLGIKQPKALGKGRTERDFRYVKTFLESGQLPEEYLAEFGKMLG